MRSVPFEFNVTDISRRLSIVSKCMTVSECGAGAEARGPR
jgi:hypothetical protein